MKNKNDELSQRYLVLVKIDATNLFNRIKERQVDYLNGFSLKRNRDIFVNIFRSRYNHANFFDLSHLPIEIIEIANDFYTCSDELFWYLMNTQDMPNTIEDELIRYIHMLEKKYEGLCLYVDAELSGNKEAFSAEVESEDDQEESINFFLTEGEKQNQDFGPTAFDEEVSNSDDS